MASKKSSPLFLWKDKSGRGEVVNNIPLENIKDVTDEENYDGDLLGEWAQVAEIGNEFEGAAHYYIRTS